MEILSMNVVVSAIVDPWVTTLSFVVALAMKIQVTKSGKSTDSLMLLGKIYRFFDEIRREKVKAIMPDS